MCKVTTFWVKCQILHLKILQGHNKIVPLHPVNDHFVFRYNRRDDAETIIN